MRASLLIGTEKGLEPLHPLGTTTSRLRVYQFHHLGITTLWRSRKNIAEFFFTSSLEPEVHQQEQLLAFALREPAHHLPPAFASLPVLQGLANLPESAVELSL